MAAWRQHGLQPQGVLLVAPEEPESARLRGRLQASDRRVIWVRHREAAINVLDRQQIDALITSLAAPRIQGLALLDLALARNPEAGAILLIRPGEEERATEAMARGVIDFQRSPYNCQKIARQLERLRERQQLREEVSRLSQRLDRRLGFPNLAGNSAAMARLRSQLREIAPLEIRVLLIGEEGTGKDLVATVLHHQGPRRNGPLVRVDCAALPGRHLARRLFGRPDPSVGGRVAGLLELASDGTLYLDQVTALPLELQARVADALRTGQIRPGIDAPPVEVHPRLVASTEASPQASVEGGLLHEGFLDLIAEARIELQPLRYRRRDIAVLARHFLEDFAEEGDPPRTLTRAALDRLTEYDWPGNVRELKDSLRELGRSGAGESIDVSDLPPDIRDPQPRDAVMSLPLGISLEAAERQLIVQTLRLCGGNREKAAGVLGMGVRTLYRKLRSYRGEEGL